ncbi:MAG TPA: hypothetical protein VLB73_05195 [Patescibacteria group bacterium]|nr:hypothetical protein [Patescibacteria group bacterium]
MDLSPQQVTEIQEIEKQVNQGQQTGPKILSQTSEKDKSVLVNLLAAVGISVGTIAAVIILVVFPFGKKQVVEQPKVTTGTLTIAQPNITVTTEYVNPFSSQYSNPFVSSQNPFTQFTQ